MPAVATPLYQQSMIAPYCAKATDTSVADFWKTLGFFFDEGRLLRWKMNLLGTGHPSNPDAVIDGYHNRICLEPFAYRLGRGSFYTALGFCLRGQERDCCAVYLATNACHGLFDHVNLFTLPDSAYGLSCIWIDNSHADLTVRDGEVPAGVRTTRSGDTFVIRTDNLIMHPLPSFELLDMHYCLGRIVLLSATGDLLQDLYNFDYDDDDDYESDQFLIADDETSTPACQGLYRRA